MFKKMRGYLARQKLEDKIAMAATAWFVVWVIISSITDLGEKGGYGVGAGPFLCLLTVSWIRSSAKTAKASSEEQKAQGKKRQDTLELVELLVEGGERYGRAIKLSDLYHIRDSLKRERSIKEV